MKNKQLIALWVLGLLISNTAFSAIEGVQELEGASDYQGLPRIKDSIIIGKKQSDYDVGIFINAAEDKKWTTIEVEGKRTQLIYIGSADLSPLAAVNNYRTAFKDFGEAEEIFYCRNDTCPAKLGNQFIRDQSKTLKLSHNKALIMYSISSYYHSQAYLSAKIKNNAGEFIVSVYSALPKSSLATSSRMGLSEPAPLIHIELIQVKDFSANLEFVEASEITKDIAEKGHISLYGLYFESASATLKPESNQSLIEIAKALNNTPDLSVFVVGHTDSDGSFATNNTLSENRARAIVTALVEQYSITANRLQAVGVGQVSPVASNDNEAGKSLNRRVELVKK